MRPYNLATLIIILCFSVQVSAQEEREYPPDECPLKYPMPFFAPVQIWIDFEPLYDQATVCFLNVSEKAMIMDMLTIHRMTRTFGYIRRPHKEGFETRGGRRIAGWYAEIKNNPAKVMPGTYIGRIERFSTYYAYEWLREQILTGEKAYYWTIGYGGRLKLPGKDGYPHYQSGGTEAVLTSPSIIITKKMLQTAQRAGKKMDAEERKYEDRDRVPFKGHARLVPENDQICLDIICMREAPPPPRSFNMPPARNRISLKSVEAESIAWTVKSGEKVLFRTEEKKEKTGSVEKEDNRLKQEGDSVRIAKYELIGRMSHLSKTEMFETMEKYFAESNSKKTECTLQASVKLYVPDREGNPEYKGTLKSNTVTITREIYNSIIKGAIERIKREKLLKLKKKK